MNEDIKICANRKKWDVFPFRKNSSVYITIIIITTTKYDEILLIKFIQPNS